MKYQTINPVDNSLIKTYDFEEMTSVMQKLGKANTSFIEWKNKTIETRLEFFIELKKNLLNKKKIFAELMTLEMGKPIQQSEAEIDKCGILIDYYASYAKKQLQSIEYSIDKGTAFTQFEPLGVILGIMPWNFPFWQVFRFAVPTIIAGNTVLLKHAPNVPQCALAIQELFNSSSFLKGVFTNIFLDIPNVQEIIEHPFVQGVSLTGSSNAGKAVGEMAGKAIKKQVLELGGNDAFLVFPDANLDLAVEKLLLSRMSNCGQSCIAAKRVILHKDIKEVFTEKLIQKFQKLKVGNPLDENTNIGPLARKDLKDLVESQVKESIRKGATIISKIETPKKGSFFNPLVLDEVKPGMPAFDDEIFGPVIALITAKSEQQMMEMANNSKYGLGTAIFIENIAKGLELAKFIESGNVYINDLVKSNPIMPFGGIKESGIGKELSEMGIKEFTNAKTVFVNL